MAAGGKACVYACSAARRSECTHCKEILLVYSNGQGYMERTGIRAERIADEGGL